MKSIRQKFQVAQNQQKSYANNRRKDLEFNVGDNVFLEVTPLKGSIKAGKGKELKTRYIDSFGILKRIRKVAYRLKLPTNLFRIHDVFHVSLFKKYHLDPTHILQLEDIKLNESLTHKERPVQLLDQKVKKFRNKRICLVMVL